MIEQIVDLVTPAFQFIRQHVPTGTLPGGDLVIASLLVLGVLVSTLGAKLAKPVVTLALTGVGAGLAARYGGLLNVPLTATIVVCALVCGTIGLLLFRLWVGVAAAGLAAVIAISIYGSGHVLPHFKTFPTTAPHTVGEYVIPDVPAEPRPPLDALREAAGDFRAHLVAQDADVEKYLLLTAAGAGAFGLLIGLLAARFTLVLTTALVGTVLVTTALGLAAQSYWPQAMESFPEHGREVDLAVLGFFVASLVLQSLLTRRPAKAEPAPIAE